MLKAPSDDIFAFLASLSAIGKSIASYFLENFTHVFSLVKGPAIEALIERHSYRPNFWFFTVLIVKKGLWGHVGWRTNIILQTGFLVALDLAVTEIYNFGLAIV